jgi:hypothetical protein
MEHPHVRTARTAAHGQGGISRSCRSPGSYSKQSPPALRGNGDARVRRRPGHGAENRHETAGDALMSRWVLAHDGLAPHLRSATQASHSQTTNRLVISSGLGIRLGSAPRGPSISSFSRNGIRHPYPRPPAARDFL